MPKINIIPQLTVTPWAVESLHGKLSLGSVLSVGSIASAVYPSANLAIYVPFNLVTPVLAKQIFWYNGATVSGNVDVGIYDEKKRKIISTGSTLQAGINSLQRIDITDTWLGTGLFFLAISMDNVTGTLFSNTSGNVMWWNILGVYQQATAFPLPDPATFATPTSDYMPMFGFTTRSVI